MRAGRRQRRDRREQPWPIRLSHWANIVLFVIMAGSGLQILAAYPLMGPVGRSYGWYPLQGSSAPDWLRLGGWLAGSRALHFAFAWFFIGNGLIYLAYVLASGEWRHRGLSSGKDFGQAWRVALAYLRVGPPVPISEGYNALQRVAYTVAVGLGALLVLSGLAVYKPVQLQLLAACFGGYDGARAVHLLALLALVLFSIGHVMMVALHPRTLLTMLSGGKKHVARDDSKA
jgi:thiosulfate reductase cytochrome b subunit